MAQVEVRDPEAEAFVNWVVSYNVRKMKVYDAHYALFCYPEGGTVDDLFVYRLPDPEVDSRDYFFLAINAFNREKDVAWLNAHAGSFDAKVRDIAD